MFRWRTRLPVCLISFSSICLLLSGCGGGSSSATNLVSFGNPAWSPDGRKVAFTRDVVRSDGSLSTDDTELYTANLDGTGLTRLTTNHIAEDAPRWSPDGTRLVFSQPGSPISVIHADGSGLTAVSPVGKSASSPDWSPDGQHLVYVATDNTSTEIYTVRADGTDERRITQRESSKWSPRWSPDGTRIAFVESGSAAPAVVILPADGINNGTSAVDIPHDPFERVMPSVTWAPDGQKIAFTTLVYNGGESPSMGLLYVANADGTGQPAAVSRSINLVQPDWSSDGTRFLFVGQDGLASMKTDGSDVHFLPIR